jgi:proline dehydrogenase
MGLKEAVVFRLAKHWIAGTTADAALVEAADANRRGLDVALNYLGEEVTEATEADANVSEYMNLQKAISEKGIRGHVSVKLTQFGLLVDEQSARRRFGQVLENARALHQELYVDMEGSSVLERTLQIYTDALSSYDMVGIALQAYLRRSGSDLEGLLDKGARVRLVKGAYNEPPELVFKTRREISENFAVLMESLFKRGKDFLIATHDPALIRKGKELAGSNQARFEFQMLKGIQDGLKVELVRDGFRVGEYLPYGASWWAYSKRRVTEHPSNIILLIRSLV